MPEVEAGEGVFIGKEHAVVERSLGVEPVTQHDVTEFVGENHGQRGFIRQHVEQAATDHDGVTDGE